MRTSLSPRADRRRHADSSWVCKRRDEALPSRLAATDDTQARIPRRENRLGVGAHSHGGSVCARHGQRPRVGGARVMALAKVVFAPGAPPAGRSPHVISAVWFSRRGTLSGSLVISGPVGL